MANFAVTNENAGTQAALGTGMKTIVLTQASSGTQALRRGKWYDVLVGTDGTPADNYVTYDISRITSSPTTGHTATSPLPLDTSDSSAACLAYANSSSTAAEATTTSSSALWYAGVNQRASYRWVAAPGSELVYPATAVNGLTLRAGAAGGATSTVTGAVLFMEQ